MGWRIAWSLGSPRVFGPLIPRIESEPLVSGHLGVCLACSVADVEEDEGAAHCSETYTERIRFFERGSADAGERFG